MAPARCTVDSTEPKADHYTCFLFFLDRYTTEWHGKPKEPEPPRGARDTEWHGKPKEPEPPVEPVPQSRCQLQRDVSVDSSESASPFRSVSESANST